MEMENYDSAEKIFHEAIGFDHNNAEAYLNLTHLQLFQDKPEKAILNFHKSLDSCDEGTNKNLILNNLGRFII